MQPAAPDVVAIATAPRTLGIEFPNVPMLIELDITATSVSDAACAAPTCCVASASVTAVATPAVAVVCRAR